MGSLSLVAAKYTLLPPPRPLQAAAFSPRSSVGVSVRLALHRPAVSVSKLCRLASSSSSHTRRTVHCARNNAQPAVRRAARWDDTSRLPAQHAAPRPGSDTQRCSGAGRAGTLRRSEQACTLCAPLCAVCAGSSALSYKSLSQCVDFALLS